MKRYIPLAFACSMFLSVLKAYGGLQFDIYTYPHYLAYRLVLVTSNLLVTPTWYIYDQRGYVISMVESIFTAIDQGLIYIQLSGTKLQTYVTNDVDALTHLSELTFDISSHPTSDSQ